MFSEMHSNSFLAGLDNDISDIRKQLEKVQAENRLLRSRYLSAAAVEKHKIFEETFYETQAENIELKREVQKLGAQVQDLLAQKGKLEYAAEISHFEKSVIFETASALVHSATPAANTEDRISHEVRELKKSLFQWFALNTQETGADSAGEKIGKFMREQFLNDTTKT